MQQRSCRLVGPCATLRLRRCSSALSSVASFPFSLPHPLRRPRSPPRPSLRSGRVQRAAGRRKKRKVGWLYAACWLIPFGPNHDRKSKPVGCLLRAPQRPHTARRRLAGSRHGLGNITRRRALPPPSPNGVRKSIESRSPDARCYTRRSQGLPWAFYACSSLEVESG